MSAFILILLCTVAVSVQIVYGQCQLRSSYNVGSCGGGLSYGSLPSPWVSSSCGAIYDAGLVPASNGGGFFVTSASSAPPSGVSVLSENEYAGILAVTGQVPLLGTAYLEGSVPSAGVGSVTYGCGYDKVAIVSEDGGASGIMSPWVADIGFNGRNPCGCGRRI